MVCAKGLSVSLCGIWFVMSRYWLVCSIGVVARCGAGQGNRQPRRTIRSPIIISRCNSPTTMPQEQSLVISVAYNLLEVLRPGPDRDRGRDFRAGHRPVARRKPEPQAFDSLVAQGVRFDVCMNTVDTIERETGQRPQLNPNAIPVEAGVAQILTLVAKGFTLVRP